MGCSLQLALAFVGLKRSFSLLIPAFVVVTEIGHSSREEQNHAQPSETNTKYGLIDQSGVFAIDGFFIQVEGGWGD